MPSNVPRIPVELPIWHYKRFILLTAVKRQSRAGMLSQMTQTLIEQDSPQILAMARSLARENGQTFEQFCLELWADNGLEDTVFDLDDV